MTATAKQAEATQRREELAAAADAAAAEAKAKAVAAEAAMKEAATKEAAEKAAIKKVEDAVAQLTSALADPAKTPSPEHIELVQTVGKKFVIPACDKPSVPAHWGGKPRTTKDWTAAGACQF